MKKQLLKEMSNEELLKKEKLLKVFTYTFVGVLVALFLMNIYLSKKTGSSTSLIVPFALFPILIINMNSLKEIKKEISSRKIK